MAYSAHALNEMNEKERADRLRFSVSGIRSVAISDFSNAFNNGVSILGRFPDEDVTRNVL